MASPINCMSPNTTAGTRRLIVTALADVRLRLLEASLRNDLAALTALNTVTDPYAAGYRDYCVGVAAMTRGEERQAKKALVAAAETLSAIVEDDPANAEAQALLGQVHGLRIGLSPMKGMFLGPKADRHIDAALSLEAGNPRALMFRGIALYNTPSMFGGDKREALRWLTKAIDAFDAGAGGWGHAEAYIWRGLTRGELGEPAAEDDFKAALALEPEYAWAASLLREARVADAR